MASMLKRFARACGRRQAQYLNQPLRKNALLDVSDPARMPARCPPRYPHMSCSGPAAGMMRKSSMVLLVLLALQPAVTAYWFAWYAFHPDTGVYYAG